MMVMVMKIMDGTKECNYEREIEVRRHGYGVWSEEEVERACRSWSSGFNWGKKSNEEREREN